MKLIKKCQIETKRVLGQLQNSSIFQILFFFSFLSLQASPISFPYVKEQVENRWHIFQKNRDFKPFGPGKSDAELKEEFENIHNTRLPLWTTSDYERAKHLVAADLIRALGCEAFNFNNTAPYYNASTIYLGEKYYIACEGPRSKDVPHFFRLLRDQHVTHLIRLTSSYEGWTKKCHPYWEDLIEESQNGTAYLNIPTETGVHPVRVFHMDGWRDNQGIDPKELLALVLQVKEELKQENSLLVVHCSAGVGRTGTFLAALAIVDAIDEQTSFSIEEIVYRLSLQRAHSVGKWPQYITLHRLGEIYLNQIKRSPPSQ